MPTGNAVDYKWYRYTANDASTWAVKVDKTWGDHADSGFAAFNAADPVMPRTSRFRPRVIIMQDPVSTRKTARVVGSSTATAWTTAGYPSTQIFRGLAGVVVVAKIDQRDERIPHPRGINSLPEPVNV